MNAKEALNEIYNNYDAFYIGNKYGGDEYKTHKKEFDILIDFVKNDEMGGRAVSWIMHEYDCYYKNEYADEKDDNAFNYLKKLIEKSGESL